MRSAAHETAQYSFEALMPRFEALEPIAERLCSHQVNNLLRGLAAKPSYVEVEIKV